LSAKPEPECYLRLYHSERCNCCCGCYSIVNPQAVANAIKKCSSESYKVRGMICEHAWKYGCMVNECCNPEKHASFYNACGSNSCLLCPYFANRMILCLQPKGPYSKPKHAALITIVVIIIIHATTTTTTTTSLFMCVTDLQSLPRR